MRKIGTLVLLLIMAGVVINAGAKPRADAAGGWGTPVQLLAAGAPAPGGGTLAGILWVHMNTRGDVAFYAWYQASPGAPVVGGIFKYASGITSRVAVPGDAAPTGGVYTFVENGGPQVFDMNDNGDIVFIAQTSLMGSGEAIFLTLGDQQVVGVGDATPLGGSIANFKWAGGEVHVNDSVEISFSASLNGGSAAAALFTWASGVITPVVWDGEARPGGGVFGGNSSIDTIRVGNDNSILFRFISFPERATIVYRWDGSSPRSARSNGRSDAEGGYFRIP